jgi:two-component system nitrogen regulation sensor histidine kinase GlnL
VTLYLIISSLCNFLAAATLALSAIVTGKKTQRNVSFGIFALSVGLWSAAYFLWQISEDEASALMFCRLLMIGASFVPVTLFDYVCRLTDTSRPWVTRSSYVLAVGMASLVPTDYCMQGVRSILGYKYWPVAGPGFIYFLGYFTIYTVDSWRRLYAGLGGLPTARARRQAYILIALVVGFVGGATNFPLWYGIGIPPVGNGLVVVYLAMLGYAISKQRFAFLNADILRGAAYVSIGLTLAVFYTLMLAMLRPWFGVEVNSSALLNNFLYALIIALLGIWLVPKLIKAADRLAEMAAGRGGNAERGKLAELAKRIATLEDEETIFLHTSRAIAESLELSKVGVFFRDELQQDQRLQAGYGWTGATALSHGDPLLERLRAHPLPLVVEELEDSSTQEIASGALETCRRLGIELAVPIHVEGALWGVVLCGAGPGGRYFADLDISLLEALCLQVGLAVRSRQLERRANQTEKLISLGTLAAGLAHELRNPLVSIRTFSSLIEEQGNDPEFRREFRVVVGRDVSRIAAIVENVSAFAANTQVAFVPVRIAEVVRAVHDIARTEFVDAGVTFSLSEPADLPGISGNYSQLLQVFLNLFQNAIHALEGRPEPSVTVICRLVSDDEGGRTLIVSVADNGAGIDEGVRSQIFDPFITTKATGDSQKRGMGLGLAIVKRIVEGHGGAITVSSETGRGTTFFVHLPCLP